MQTTRPDAAFWSKIAPKYAARQISDVKGYQRTLERTISYLKSTDSALEIGCGTGSTALLLAPHVAQITATDLAPGMIEIANEKKAAAECTNVTFAVADILAHPPQGGPLDVVLAHNLLHLLPNQPKALAQIHEMLRDGGLFISKTVCAPSRPTLKYALIRWVVVPLMQAFGKAPYVAFCPVAELEARIIGAGFDIIETGDQKGPLPSRYIVARKR